MHDAEPTSPGSIITGGGFLVDLSGELERLRVPAHQSRYMNLEPVHWLTYTQYIFTRHQVSAGVTFTSSIEEHVAA